MRRSARPEANSRRRDSRRRDAVAQWRRGDAAIGHHQPSIKVLVVSMHSDEADISRALQAGAKGYLLKDSAGDDLIKGVAAVVRARLSSATWWRNP